MKSDSNLSLPLTDDEKANCPSQNRGDHRKAGRQISAAEEAHNMHHRPPVGQSKKRSVEVPTLVVQRAIDQ